MDRPLISVVLPLYNGARYVEKSIASLVNQTYPNWELIVHDAASTDRTPEVLAEIWQKYPILQERGQIIREAEKINVPKALNIGFRTAKGNLFSWTSDDNIYLPDALEKMHRALMAHPECSLLYAHSYTIDSKGERTGVRRSLPLEHLVYGNNVGLCFLFKKEVFERIDGYNENRFTVEDYDFWMRASEHFKFFHLDEILYEIRYHAESLTDNNRNKMYYLAEDIFEEDFPRMKQWLPVDWQIRGHLRLVRTGLKQAKWGRALRHGVEAIFKSPTLTVKESFLKLNRGLRKNASTEDQVSN